MKRQTPGDNLAFSLSPDEEGRRKVNINVPANGTASKTSDLLANLPSWEELRARAAALPGDRVTDPTLPEQALSLCLSVQAPHDYLTAAKAQAEQSPLPPAAHRYQLPAMRLLVAICRELQGLAGDAPFHLGCRPAGALLGIPHQIAHRWLWRLVHDGVLTIAKAGTSGPGGKATRYRYVGDTFTSSDGPYREGF